MSLDTKMLAVAAREALRGNNRYGEKRQFMIGAVGIRKDGVIVYSRNVAAAEPAPNHHAETRLVRKMTPGSVVWVARVAKGSGDWAMARPCPNCQRRLKAAGIEKVIYTIGPGEWGTMEP